MNNYSHTDFLLNATTNNSHSTTKSTYTSTATSEFKTQFKSQLQTADSQLVSLAQQLRTLTNNTAKLSGGSLPIPEVSRNFLADLPEDKQQPVIEGVSRWLADMSPEELQTLKKDFEDDPESVIEKMPPELQELLAGLENTEGFSEFLAGLLGADIDFQRLAVLARGDYLSLVAKDLTVKADDAQNAFNNKLTIKQQATDSHALAKDKVGDLVSSLNKISATGGLAAVSPVRAGGENLNQLLQSAGMGLVGTQAANTATQTAPRITAGVAALPFMMQAAADSNAQALANRINLMNAKNMQVAEMRLDPPKLGSVKVKIRIQGDQASVAFQAANPHARELLEQSLPKLREMMEAQGLMLADVEVSDESLAGQGQRQQQGELKQSNQLTGSNFADEEGLDGIQIPLLTQPLGLIDYYA
ncbi:MAG TPA: flagellar hook-length control protein FliK [Marinospirillum sp.]|uniref:flagellar hook-length control protein FliK n=1 Tax=Marinospirillum sp. TaxID=2183934 RepID=UPI002B45BD86|nr:flagellar hook-length control protein FliK [Marinospirillum sp.]HKM16435.1 flagellar hook-length control protein FliK [Marinospirillum sp.]